MCLFFTNEFDFHKTYFVIREKYIPLICIINLQLIQLAFSLVHSQENIFPSNSYTYLTFSK